MQNWFVFNMVSSLSVAPAAALGIYHLRRIATRFIPFVIITWLGLLSELVSLYCIFLNGSNACTSNVYVLVEFLLFVWLFYRWQYQATKLVYIVMVVVGLVVWLIDNILVNTLNQFNAGFRVFYAFVIVVFSIQKAKDIVGHESRLLTKHSQFWLCMAFILFYSFKAFLESFYLFDIGASRTFFIRLFFVMQLVNLFTNIIFAIVYLWMPKKQDFLLQY
jgi:hypothetical protein